MDEAMHPTRVTPAVQAYVRQLGAEVLGGTAGNYAFDVMEDPEVAAWATCAGHVYVTTGLLRDVEDESELAVVLAHEVVHNERHHLVRALRKQGASSPWPPRVDGDDEDEADEDGLKRAVRAGFDGGAQLRLFRRWQAREARDPLLFRTLRATHPSTAHRIRKAQWHAAFEPTRHQQPSRRFADFKRVLM
jgi:predicted Zn-dependent protease